MDRENANPSCWRVLADHAHAAPPAFGGGVGASVRFELHHTRTDRLQPEDRPQQFRAARADQPGDADDLAPVQGKRGAIGHLVTRGEIVDFQHHLAGGAGGARVEVIHVAADHQRDDPLDRHPGQRAGADVLAVAQDRVLVAERLHLLQRVGNVDDGHAARLEPPHQHEQLGRVGLRQ